MKYEICDYDLNDGFFLPTGIVDKNLAFCGAVQLKVLLVVFRYKGENLTAEDIARILNLPQADIKDALNFWVNAGTLKICATCGDNEAAETRKDPRQNAAQDISKKPKPRLAKMTSQEVSDMAQRQPVIRRILHETEGILGKTLTSADISTLVSLYDWAGVSDEIILMAVTYCASIDKRNLRYIEKTALSWQELGLDSTIAVNEYLGQQSKQRKQEQAVQNAFGLQNRRLTEREKSYIQQWCDEFHDSIELIKLAYEKAVDQTGKVSFPYIHKILSSWNERGFTTAKDVLQEKDLHTESKKITEKETYSFDLEKFAKAQRQHIPKID